MLVLGVIGLLKGLQSGCHDRVALAEVHLGWVLKALVLVLHLLHDHKLILQLWLELALVLVHDGVLVLSLGLQDEAWTHLDSQFRPLGWRLLLIFA